jgi:GLPGLI family protein
MKKFFRLTFVIFLFSVNIFSQKGIIKYSYTEALQIGNEKGYEYSSYLIFNKDQSYYVTAKDSLEKIEKASEQKTYSNEDNGNKVVHLGAKVSSLGDQVVYNIKKNTIWSSFYCKNMIFIKEVKPEIDWKINKETKKIGNFTCKKATASFRGRNYTAWFTTEIPLPFGPWKLQGLPGLILEAYDTNKFVYWAFNSAEYPSKTKENVKYLSIPVKEKTLNYEEFKKFQIKVIEQNVDKLKIAKKQFPDMEFFPPKISDIFIECE